MDINCYALEVITKARLAELRADAARHALVALSRGQVLHSRISGPDSAPADQRLSGPDVGFQDLTPLTRR